MGLNYCQCIQDGDDTASLDGGFPKQKSMISALTYRINDRDQGEPSGCRTLAVI